MGRKRMMILPTTVLPGWRLPGWVVRGLVGPPSGPQTPPLSDAQTGPGKSGKLSQKYPKKVCVTTNNSQVLFKTAFRTPQRLIFKSHIVMQKIVIQGKRALNNLTLVSSSGSYSLMPKESNVTLVPHITLIRPNSKRSNYSFFLDRHKKNNAKRFPKHTAFRSYHCYIAFICFYLRWASVIAKWSPPPPSNSALLSTASA